MKGKYYKTAKKGKKTKKTNIYKLQLVEDSVKKVN